MRFKKKYFTIAIATILLLNLVLILFYNLNESANETFFIQSLQDTIQLVGNNISNANRLHKYFDAHLISLSAKSDGRVLFNGYTHGGYGNKLYSFITSFLIALITNTPIIVRWNEIDEFISPPLNLFYKIDNKTKNYLNPEYQAQKICTFKPQQPWALNKDVDKFINALIPNNCSRYLYADYYAYFMEICCNPVYFDKLLHYGLVNKATISKALHVLEAIETLEKQKSGMVFKVGYNIGKFFSNQIYKPKNVFDSAKKDALFMVGFEVGGNILNKIWTPKNFIINEIDYYLSNHFHNSFVIGMQMRFEYLNKQIDVEKFLDCALKIENEYLSINKHEPKKRIKWFISSDSESNINEIISLYPNKAFSSNGSITNVYVSSNGYKRAIIDVELLSKCDEIIMTGGSTFGFVASMKSLRLPFYVNGNSTSTESCLKTSLSQLSQTPTGYAVF